jgi:hypothetical protein
VSRLRGNFKAFQHQGLNTLATSAFSGFGVALFSIHDNPGDDMSQIDQAVNATTRLQAPPSGLVAQPTSPSAGLSIPLPPEQADKPSQFTMPISSVTVDNFEGESGTDMDSPVNASDLNDPPRRLIGLTAQDFLTSQPMDDETASNMEDDDEDDEDEEWDCDPTDMSDGLYGSPWESVPIVIPRRVFTGARNIDTVKDGQ